MSRRNICDCGREVPRSFPDKPSCLRRCLTSILAVDDKGFVTAIGEGEATISVKRRAEPTDVASVPVRVHAVSEEAGIELSASSMVSTVGKPMFLNALLAPSMRGSRVEWALSSASLGSIAPDEGEPCRAPSSPSTATPSPT